MAGAATNVNNSSSLQTALAHKAYLLRLRGADPFVGGKSLLAPVVLRIESGQLSVAHLWKGSEHSAPGANGDRENAVRVAQPIRCGIDFARGRAAAQFASLLCRFEVVRHCD